MRANTKKNNDIPMASYVFTNPNLQENVPFDKITSRIAYKAFIKVDDPSSQKKWEDEFNFKPDWQPIWKCARAKYLDKNQGDLNWRIIHRSLKTNYLLHKAGIV